MRFAAAIVVAFGVLVLAPAQAHASCIGATVQQVSSGLTVPSGALVVVGPLESDVPPSPNRGDELALRVATLVAGRIAGARVHPRVLALDSARTAAARSASLVYVHVQLVKGQLRVTADAYPVVRNIWDRARLAPPPPNGHAYSVAPVDAEVRAFFPALPLELQSVRKVTHGETSEVLAAACGDLDGDGGSEIMLVTRDRASVGRIRGAKLDVERAAAWSVLAKRSPVPLREALAGAGISVGRAFIGTSDRGGVIVDELLAPRAVSSGIPVGGGSCAAISTARLSFTGPIAPCESTTHPSAMGAFDAASALMLVSPAGEEKLAVATREGGKIHVRVDGAEKSTFDDAGAEIALFDANLDGMPEIAFSSEGAEDVITIATIGAEGPRVLNRIAAPGGVRALAACPSEGGAGAVVAVVGSEVWIVR